MNLRQIGIVYRKELIDALRDRRTIISTIVIPIVMFPLIVFGFGAMMTKTVQRAQSEGSKIMIIGAENSPALVERIKSGEGLMVEQFAADFTNRIADKQLRAAIDIPAGFDSASGTNAPPVKIYHYAGEMRSQFAVRNLQGIVRDYRNEVVEKRLREKGLSSADLKPFEVKEQNVAPPTKVGGNMLGGIIPYLIILLSFMGCMAPALDLTAGEKERGTIETILASPIGRTELVLGKFCLVVTASMVTTMISLLSNAATFAVPFLMAREFTRAAPFQIDLSGLGVLGVFVMVIPLAVTFGAAQLAIASFARTYREAQSYISPLIMVIILPATAALLPGFDLDFKTSLIPIFNVSLICKEVLSGTFHWGLIAMVFLSSCVYAGVALWGAITAFKSESVIFRT